MNLKITKHCIQCYLSAIFVLKKRFQIQQHRINTHFSIDEMLLIILHFNEYPLYYQIKNKS